MLKTDQYTLTEQSGNYANRQVLYMYKFLRDVIFEGFVVNWPPVKFSSSKFHWQTFSLYQSESRILVNGYAATFNTSKGLWQVLILPAAAVEVVSKLIQVNYTFTESIMYVRDDVMCA